MLQFSNKGFCALNLLESFRNYLDDALNKKKCISKSELSRRSGLSRVQIDRYLEGQGTTIHAIQRIADAIGVNPLDILTDKAPPDALLVRILAVWQTLNIGERASVVGVAEALAKAKLDAQARDAVTKGDKPSS